jgi:hypothetical protein
MPFAPEWLYLDELIALLGPSPDVAHVDRTFRRALDEGVLRDRDNTPAEVWRRRFEIGNAQINFNSGMMFVPWYDRRRPDHDVMPLHPQFRRADWIALFDIAASDSKSKAPKAPSPTTFLAAYKDRLQNWTGGRPPTFKQDEVWAAKEFVGLSVSRAAIRTARKETAPPGGRPKGPPTKSAK